jgi:large subunit ribosomal protein L13
VITNASKLVATGGKETKKVYYRHSGYPGGLYSKTLREQDPIEAFRKAIRGMLPDNKLRTGRLERLKIYEGPEHNHNAQMPKEISVKGDK